jgi:PAS domain S-box-containing protein
VSAAAISRRRVAAAFSVMAVVVFLGVVQSWRSLRSAGEAAGHMHAAFAAIERIGRAETRLADLESAQRAYLLTGEPSYLDRYRVERAAMQEAVAELQGAADTPEDVARYVLLDQRLQRRLQIAERAIAARMVRQVVGDAPAAMMAEGSAAADGVRQLLHQSRRGQERILRERSQRYEWVSMAAIGAVAAAGAGALLAVIAGLFAAARAERRLTTLLHELAVGFVARDEKGRITLANPAAARIIGRPASELIGEPMEKAIPGAGSLDEGSSAERRVETLGKSVRVILQASGHAVFLEDVTELAAERHRSGELLDRLAAANDLLNGVIEGSTGMIAALDKDRRFKTFNSAYAAEFLATFGREIRVGDQLDDALAHLPGELAKMLAVWERAVRGETFRVVGEFGADPRQKRWYEIRYSPVRNSRGELVGAAQIAHDVTERQRAEAELVEAKSLLEKRVEERTRDLQGALDRLRASEGRWSTLVELTPQIVWTATPQGILEYANARWYEYTGMAPDAPRESASDFIHPDDRELQNAVWAESLDTARTYNLEYRLRRSDGAYRWHIARAVPLTSAAGNVKSWLGVCVDIDEQKRSGELLRDAHARLEAEVEERTAELRTSLREKEVLLKEVHHRVKNNLQVVCSLLSMQADMSSDSDTREMFEQSQQRVLSMALIHENLYRSGDLSRIELTPYIEQVVSNLVASYSPKQGGVRHTVESSGGISLSLDRAIPCGLIVNELVSNALKHAFPSGRGTIRVRLEVVEPALRVSVEDDGVGLPPGFALATHKTLGLQIVTTLVRQLRGKLGYSSADGAVFTLEFAMAPPERQLPSVRATGR